jgi:hypothetical protein
MWYGKNGKCRYSGVESNTTLNAINYMFEKMVGISLKRTHDIAGLERINARGIMVDSNGELYVDENYCYIELERNETPIFLEQLQNVNTALKPSINVSYDRLEIKTGDQVLIKVPTYNFDISNLMSEKLDGTLEGFNLDDIVHCRLISKDAIFESEILKYKLGSHCNSLSVDEKEYLIENTMCLTNNRNENDMIDKIEIKEFRPVDIIQVTGRIDFEDNDIDNVAIYEDTYDVKYEEDMKVIMELRLSNDYKDFLRNNLLRKAVNVKIKNNKYAEFEKYVFLNWYSVGDELKSAALLSMMKNDPGIANDDTVEIMVSGIEMKLHIEEQYYGNEDDYDDLY